MKPRETKSKSPKRKDFVRVGGARNEHGTRLSKRVTCSHCGKEDYVSKRAKDYVLCRACAAQILNAYEEGVRVPTDMTTISCAQCGQDFACPTFILQKDEKELLCYDCMRGFDTWRGAAKQQDKQKDTVIEVRRTGTALRKQKPV